MYAYDTMDQAFVAQRSLEFRDQVERRLRGELSEDEFRPLRLHNGLYLQVHAYMLRVAIPYGTLSVRQLRALTAIARRYDRGYGHFTTRQNIQFNWIKLEEAPDILDALAKVEMHAIQTSGNLIRNVTTDVFAGAAADEDLDPRPYAELIRQWSTLHPEFSFLPRKFKIAIAAARKDRAALRLHDIGIHIRLKDGAPRFEILVGGGMGRTPRIGQRLRADLPPEELLSYLEATLRVYNEEGRRDNKYKARIKILVGDVGIDALREKVDAEWERIRGGPLRVDAAALDRLIAAFPPPPPRLDPGGDPARWDSALGPQFAAWRRHNLHPHKVNGYVSATVSLKPVGGIPGDATAEQLEAVADLAEALSLGEVRVSHEQNLVLPHVPTAAVAELWRGLSAQGLATPNAGTVADIVACPGLDYCAIASARSIPIAQDLSRRFAAVSRLEEVGELKVRISGCVNACGHHHVGAIGILGIDKRGEEAYQLMLGGDPGDQASLGQILGPALSAEEVGDAFEAVITAYLALREGGEIFIDTVRRLGAAPFKEAVYGPRQLDAGAHAFAP